MTEVSSFGTDSSTFYKIRVLCSHMQIDAPQTLAAVQRNCSAISQSFNRSNNQLIDLSNTVTDFKIPKLFPGACACCKQKETSARKEAILTDVIMGLLSVSRYVPQY